MTDRLTGIDWLRGIAAFGIIGCHLNLDPHTPAAGALYHFTDMNVGLFAAISGFFMARHFSETFAFKEYVKKRISRLLPVYLVWSAIYVVATCVFDIVLDGGAINPRFYRLDTWGDIVFRGGSCSQLWFLIDLLYCELIFAGVRAVAPRLLSGMVIPGALSYAMLVVSCSFSGHFFLYTMRLFSFVMLGLSLGNCYRLYHAQLRERTMLLGLLLVCALVFHITCPMFCHRFIRDYICVIPLILLAVTLAIRSTWFSQKLASTSLGIYLIHSLPAAVLGFIIRHSFGAPYSAELILLDWIILWLFSAITIHFLMCYRLTAKFVQ